MQVQHVKGKDFGDCCKPVQELWMSEVDGVTIAEDMNRSPKLFPQACGDGSRVLAWNALSWCARRMTGSFAEPS